MSNSYESFSELNEPFNPSTYLGCSNSQQESKKELLNSNNNTLNALSEDIKDFFIKNVKKLIQIVSAINPNETLEKLNNYVVGEKGELNENEKRFSENIVGLFKTLLNGEKYSNNQKINFNRLNELKKFNDEQLFEEIKKNLKSLHKINDGFSTTSIFNQLYAYKYIVLNNEENPFSSLDSILLENYLSGVEKTDNEKLSKNFVKLFNLKKKDLPDYLFKMKRYFGDKIRSDNGIQSERAKQLYEKDFRNADNDIKKTNKIISAFYGEIVGDTPLDSLKNEEVTDKKYNSKISKTRNISYTNNADNFRITYFNPCYQHIEKDILIRNGKFPDLIVSQCDKYTHIEEGFAVAKIENYYYIGKQNDKLFENNNTIIIDTLNHKVYKMLDFGKRVLDVKEEEVEQYINEIGNMLDKVENDCNNTSFKTKSFDSYLSSIEKQYNSLIKKDFIKCNPKEIKVDTEPNQFYDFRIYIGDDYYLDYKDSSNNYYDIYNISVNRKNDRGEFGDGEFFHIDYNNHRASSNYFRAKSILNSHELHTVKTELIDKILTNDEKNIDYNKISDAFLKFEKKMLKSPEIDSENKKVFKKNLNHFFDNLFFIIGNKKEKLFYNFSKYDYYDINGKIISNKNKKEYISNCFKILKYIMFPGKNDIEEYIDVRNLGSSIFIGTKDGIGNDQDGIKFENGNVYYVNDGSNKGSWTVGNSMGRFFDLLNQIYIKNQKLFNDIDNKNNLNNLNNLNFNNKNVNKYYQPNLNLNLDSYIDKNRADRLRIHLENICDKNYSRHTFC